MSDRLYTLKYVADGAPTMLKDVGNLLQLAGIILQGKGTTVVVMAPTACQDGDGGHAELEVIPMEVMWPPYDLWAAILAQSDDPLFAERDASGALKAWHRKATRGISGFVQQKVWARDGFRCLYCGARMGDLLLTIDHFVPLELDGPDTPDNLVTACRKCNKSKGDMHPQQFCEIRRLDYYGLTRYLAGQCSIQFIVHLDFRQ